MKSNQAKKLLKRVLCLLILSAYLVGNIVIPIPTAQAAESDEISSYSVDEPFDAASDQNSLPSDASQEEELDAMGFSTYQPSREAPSGKEVDKSKNPLGPDTVMLNRSYQLAFSMGNYLQPDNLRVYNNPIGIDKISFNNPLTTSSPASANNFKFNFRKVVAVDTDGDGHQEVVNIGQLAKEIKLYVSDFHNTSYGTPTSSSIYTVTTNASSPRYSISAGNHSNKVKDYTTYSGNVLMAAAGDFDHDGSEEVAIGYGNTLYVCKVTKNSFKLLAQKSYNDANFISSVNAVDTNNDGFSELVVITSGDTYLRVSYMYFYDGAYTNGKIDLSAPSYSSKLAYSDNYYIDATVDIGDLLGDGDKTIVIGGITAKGTHCISYIKYNPVDENYSELSKLYSMQADSKTEFKAIINSYIIKCVSLDTPKNGTPEYVVFGGYIFKYNTQTDSFDRMQVKDYYVDSKDAKKNDTGKTDSNITDANKSKDETVIMDILVGNFDDNSEGKEQIIMLHYNEWYTHDNYIYLTQCYMNDENIYVNLRELSHTKENDTKTYSSYPTICAVDVLNRGTKLKFIPSKSTFTYTDPMVVAVLGASPYYEELEDVTEALGNVETTFGSSDTSGSSSSNGYTISAGASIGYEQSYSAFGVEVAKTEFELSFKTAFTNTYTNSTSIERSVSYSNYYSEDAVVMTVIPYDIYFYEATVWDGSKYVTDEITLQIPYAPMTTMMPVEDYNKLAATMDNAPIISNDVLKHTVGDPRTYPQSSKGLSNLGEKALTFGSTDANSFRATGYGNNSVDQGITTTSGSEKEFDFSFEAEFNFKLTFFGITGGVSAGAGYNNTITISNEKSTSYSGSVASLPSTEYSDYQFNWDLVVYKSALYSKSGKKVQECPVVSYICKPVGNYPPKVPKNLTVSSQDIGGISLRWDKAEMASMYSVERAEEKDEDKNYTPIANISGNSNTLYKDTKIEQGKNYYYRVRAIYGTKKSIPSESLYVPALIVKEIQVKRQPKLTYKEYETLDLSNLIVTLVMDNSSLVDVAYLDFGKYNLSVNLKDGRELDSLNNGSPLIITYAPLGLSAYTNALVVKEITEYPLLLTVNFTMGDTLNAIYLEPGKCLTANINLENTTESTTTALVILALYNDDMTMVNYITRWREIPGDSTIDLSCSLTMPSDVTGYTAKVFVWDGTSMENSNLIPLSDTVQIPY